MRQIFSPRVHSDLTNLLLGDRQQPAGQFDHSGWELYPRGLGQSLPAQLASAHEVQHHILNHSTAYGILLTIAALMYRTHECSEAQFTGLVGNCRSAHEMFATAISVMHMPDSLAATDYLSVHMPDYHALLEDALWMVKGVAEDQHMPLIHAVLVASFQSPEIVAVLEKGQPLKPSASAYPDRRLTLLADWLVSGGDRLASEWIKSRSFAAAQANLAKASHITWYECLMAHSNVHGVTILPPDAHLEYLASWHELLPAMAPRAAKMVGVREFDDASPTRTTLRQMEQERVVDRSDALPATLHRPTDISCWNLHDLLVHAADYVFILVEARITERLREQFSFQTTDIAELNSDAHDFSVHAVSFPDEFGGPRTLWRISNPSGLAVFHQGEIPVLAFVSLLLASDTAFDPWMDEFDRVTRVFVWDISFADHIPALFEPYDAVNVLSGELVHDDGSATFVAFLAYGTHGGVDLFMARTGPVVAQLVVQWSIEASDRIRVASLTDLNQELNWLISTAMSHLLGDRHHDTQSLQSDYSFRCKKARRLRTLQQG